MLMAHPIIAGKLYQGPAIYGIKCLVNGKLYIGSSFCLYQRWATHRRQLRQQRHCNKFFQNCYNKHGEKGFSFQILEKVSQEKLIEREQFWLDLANSLGIGINARAIASSNLGIKATQETRDKMSKSGKGKKHNMSEDGIKSLQNSLCKEWNFISPSGQDVYIFNLSKFCKENNLNGRNMQMVHSGVRYSHKGWTANTGRVKLDKGLPFKIKSPKGEIINGINLTKFCRENKLQQGNMMNVILKKRKSHKGYILC